MEWEPKIWNFQNFGTLIRTKTIQKEVTPQLYHSDEDDHDEMQSQYSNELSQLRNIDKTLLVKPGSGIHGPKPVGPGPDQDRKNFRNPGAARTRTEQSLEIPDQLGPGPRQS